jgi:GTP-binding protein Era
VHDVDVVVFVIEAICFDERDAQILKLLPVDKPVILVINKVDRLADKSKLLPFLAKLSKEFAFSAMVPISAEHGTQLPELICTIRPYLPEGPFLFREDEITDRSERFIAAELVREKLFRLMWDEIPYSVSVAIDQFTVESGLRRIHASIIVDRANQKAMIIGKNGEELKAVATRARKDMEKLFGSKVYLKVWVKVKRGWADDLRALKTLGYE